MQKGHQTKVLSFQEPLGWAENQ